MISFKQTHNGPDTLSFLDKAGKVDVESILRRYGAAGVAALASATPYRTGKTANSWVYVIKHSKGKSTIEWHNSNVQDGVSVAVILQYGHGTGNGGYVQGYDYINPAIRPIFDRMTDDIWKEVSAK